MLNHVTKSGASWAQTCGSIGLLYALSDFAIHKIRGGADDEINMVSSATVTGLIYRSPGKHLISTIRVFVSSNILLTYVFVFRFIRTRRMAKMS